MGLDNGISLRVHKKIEEFPQYINMCEREVKEYKPENENSAVYIGIPTGDWEYEVAYWRKCWNIRQMIFEVLGQPEESETGEYDLSIEQLKKIQDNLCEIIKDPENNWAWNGIESAIFSYDDSKYNLLQQITNITYAINYMKENQGCYVSFYDSY